MNCSKCGLEIPVSANFCPVCGSPADALHPDTAARAVSEKAQPSRRLTVGIVLVGIALVGQYAAIFIPALAGQYPSTNPPTGLYVIFWTSLFFYLAWKYRTLKAWHGALIGAVIGFVALTGATMVANRVAGQAASAEVVEMLRDFKDTSRKTNPDGTPAHIEETYTPSTNAKGSMAVAQQIVADMLNYQASLRNAYAEDIESSGLNSFFDMERLKKDINLSESRRIVADARLSFEKYKHGFDKAIEYSRGQIESSELSNFLKKESLKSFDDGLRGSAKDREEMLELESASIDEFAKIIDFLATDLQSWTIEGGQILFDTQEQVDVYDKHLIRMDEIYAQQMEIQERMFERASNTIMTP